MKSVQTQGLPLFRVDEAFSRFEQGVKASDGSLLTTPGGSTIYCGGVQFLQPLLLNRGGTGWNRTTDLLRMCGDALTLSYGPMFVSLVPRCRSTSTLNAVT